MQRSLNYIFVMFSTFYGEMQYGICACDDIELGCLILCW